MNSNEKTANDFLEPKYAYLRMVQSFCDALNNNNKQTAEAKNYTDLRLDKPIIFTHSYIITGEIIPFSNIPKDETLFPLKAAKIIYDSTQKLLQDSFNKDFLEENPSKLLLIKDASIRSLSSNQITNLPVFFLFADQIVGFTFGHLD